MADASTRSFASQWTYDRSQDREGLQNEDAAQWRSVDRVAVRKRQRQQHQLEHGDPTAMDFEARVHALDAHFLHVPRRESPARSPTPSVRGIPSRNVARIRPQSASIHRRALDDVAAATDPKAVRLRPQSAKASRPDRIAPTDTSQTPIARKLPMRQNASKWTEMLARGPVFKQLNLRLLELETHELLRHAFLKHQPVEKKPRSRRRRRRDSGDKGAKPGDAGTAVACGSGLQLARSRKQRQQEHDKRMMLGQDRRSARRCGSDRAVTSHGQGPQIPVEEKRLIQEKTRRRSKLLKKKSQKQLEQPQGNRVANQEKRSPPVALQRPLSARQAGKATRATSARATKALSPETAVSDSFGDHEHANTKISPRNGAKRADAVISNPPVERVKANPALGSSASVALCGVGRRDKHGDPQEPPVSEPVLNELLSSTFESGLLLDSALLLSIPQCETTGKRVDQCEPTATPSNGQRTHDSDELLLAGPTKGEDDDGGAPGACDSPCDLAEPRRDLSAPCDPDPVVPACGQACAIGEERLIFSESEPTDQASYCIDAEVERPPAQQLGHLDCGSDSEGLDASAPQPADWNPPEKDPSDGSQAQVAATSEDRQGPVALRGSDCSNSMVRDPIETWGIEAEELSSPEFDNGLVQTLAAVLTEVPDLNSDDGEPSTLQGGGEDDKRVGGVAFSEQLMPRVTAFETTNGEDDHPIQRLSEEAIEPRRRRSLMSDEGAAVDRPSQLPPCGVKATDLPTSPRAPTLVSPCVGVDFATSENDESCRVSLFGDRPVSPNLLIRIERDRDNDLETNTSERYTWTNDEDQEEATRMASDGRSGELLPAALTALSPADEAQSATEERGSLLLAEDPDPDADLSEATQARTDLARMECTTATENGSVEDVDEVHNVPRPELCSEHRETAVECPGSDLAVNQSASPPSSSRDSSLLVSGTRVGNEKDALSSLAAQDEGFQMASEVEGDTEANTGSVDGDDGPGNGRRLSAPVPVGEETSECLEEVQSEFKNVEPTASDSSLQSSEGQSRLEEGEAAEEARLQAPERATVALLDDEGATATDTATAYSGAVDPVLATVAGDTGGLEELGVDRLQQGHDKEGDVQLHVPLVLESCAVGDTPTTTDTEEDAERGLKRQQEDAKSNEDLGVASSAFRSQQQADQSTLDPSEAPIVCSLEQPLPIPDGSPRSTAKECDSLLHPTEDPVPDADASEAALVASGARVDSHEFALSSLAIQHEGVQMESATARSELEAADEKPQFLESSRLPDGAPVSGGSSETLDAPGEDADCRAIEASAARVPPALLPSVTSNRSEETSCEQTDTGDHAAANAPGAVADSVAVPPNCGLKAVLEAEEEATMETSKREMRVDQSTAPASTLEGPPDLRGDAADGPGDGSDVPVGEGASDAPSGFKSSGTPHTPQQPLLGPSWLLEERNTSEDTRLQAIETPPAALLDEQGVMATEDTEEQEELAVAGPQQRAERAAHKESDVQASLVSEDRPAIRPDSDEEAERDPKPQQAADLHRAACRIQAQYRCFMRRRLLLDQLRFFVAKHNRKARKKLRHKATKAVACPPTASVGNDELLLATGASDGAKEAAGGRKDSCEHALDLSRPNADSSDRREDEKGNDAAAVASPASQQLQQAVDASEQAPLDPVEAQIVCSFEQRLSIADDSPHATLEPAELVQAPNAAIPSSPAALESADAVETPVWERCVDSTTGKSFYFNRRANVSQWTAPPHEPATEQPPQSAADPAWQTFVDEASGQAYYHNAETGESCWELPSTAEAPAKASPWVEYMDPETQAPYFVNLETMATSWERPAELLAAAAEAQNLEEDAYEIAIAL